MNLPFRFALRYIFSKKSTNAINLISGISVFGIALGSMALIVILSVFNGFEDLLRQLISSFKPDVHVSIIEGKVFTIKDDQIARLESIDGVEAVCKTLHEIALFEYDSYQNLGNIKGVDNQFLQVIKLDTTIERGRFDTYDAANKLQYGVVGATIEHTLHIGGLQSSPIIVYMPKREGGDKVSLGSQPFIKRELYPVGIYSVKQIDYDNGLITNLKFVQDLLAYKDDEISAIEIKIAEGANFDQVQAAIKKEMGPAFSVKNRFEQDEAFFKITNLEKWVGFLIFAFTLVLVAFNMVGALWMLVLEKRKDIASLKALGATDALVRNIFLMEGAMLSSIGVLVGSVLGVVLCILQQQFGLVQLEGSGATFLVQAYPVSMRLSDFIIVIVTVMLIGTSAALLPAMRAARIKGLLREG